MRRRWWIPAVLIVALPLAGLADPGDVVTGYGDDGRVVIDAVASNVGVTTVRSAHDGRVVAAFTGDPESGSAALVSADGSTVASIDLGGPGTAAFGPDGGLYAAFDESGQVVVSRFGADGSLDAGFGVGGRAVVPVDAAISGDLVVDNGVVVVGGTLGANIHTAWAVRFDGHGNLDSGFGEEGVVVLESTDALVADFVAAVDVHALEDGYLAVVLTRSLGGDSVEVVVFDAGGVNRITDLAYPDEIFSVASTSLSDGSVLVAVQTTANDVDTFHLTRFRPDGTPDTSFSDPGLTDDEVAGPVRLSGLRTGGVAVAYNTGPEEGFVVRLVGDVGTDLGSLDVDVDTWMYGMTALSHDGSLVFAVDDTPVSSIEPDDLTLVKVTGDESGRFIDDDGSVHEANIEELARRSITRGCNPPANTRFCPSDPVTRGQTAAFLVRALGLGPATEDAFVDDDGSVFEGDIDRLAAAGITRGCNPPANTRFCPNDPVTRGQMAALLVRALGLGPADDDAFVDDEGSIFEGDIDRLAAAGIARGCNPPANTRFCPNDPLTRAQMASFLIRALPDG